MIRGGQQRFPFAGPGHCPQPVPQGDVHRKQGQPGIPGLNGALNHGRTGAPAGDKVGVPVTLLPELGSREVHRLKTQAGKIPQNTAELYRPGKTQPHPERGTGRGFFPYVQGKDQGTIGVQRLNPAPAQKTVQNAGAEKITGFFTQNLEEMNGALVPGG
jgi:hypothetical protein